MTEKMYKASDVVGILLEEITNAEFLRVTKRLSNIPSAVVRCKDCSHTNARSKDGEYWHCVVFNLWMGKDFFCKEGDKKSE